MCIRPIVLLGLFLGGFLPSCSQGAGVHQVRQDLAALSLAAPPSVGVPGCFKIAPTPILQSGQLKEKATWNDPSVVFDPQQGKFVMYVSADHHFDKNIQIWRMTSIDGLQWALDPPNRPVVAATPGAWDRQAIETPSVVMFKDQYYLFYTGYGNDLSDFRDYKIGYAVSPDGIHWTKMSDPLVVPTAPHAAVPNLDFRQYIVAEPGAVVHNGRLMVYFTAVGADADLQTTLQTIGMVETQDGVHWTSPIQVLKPDQAVYTRARNIKGFSSPGAAVINNRVHLFMSVATDEPYVQIALHHAVSDDGKTGWEQDPAPFLKADNYDWLMDSVTSPSVLTVGDRAYLWFSGHTGFTLSLGTGMCDLRER